MSETEEIDAALKRARAHILASQLDDGSWSYPVHNDLRISAFYLNLLRTLGGDTRTTELGLEGEIAARQLPCGAWQAQPGDTGDIEVTAVLAISLADAHTAAARQAARRAGIWLESQPVPEMDGFWIGFLATTGHLEWARVPYLSPRLVNVPAWVRPNLFDVGVIRLAMVATAVIQYHRALHRTDRECAAAAAQPPWLAAWVKAARRRTRGPAAGATRLWRRLDVRRGSDAPLRAAVAWLLARQEEDGSFFSSVHLTTVVILALHTVDSTAHKDPIERGLRALQGWLGKTPDGLRLAFTDSAVWDTVLFAQVLPLLGCGQDHPAMKSARQFLYSKQIMSLGDYRHRAGGGIVGRHRAGGGHVDRHRARGGHVGGWMYQRIGRHFPDVDDTALAVTVLLASGNHSPQEIDRLQEAVRWIISMQGSNGGWAGWARNDRGWVRLMGGGKWFFVDEPCPAIAARTASILDRIGRGEFAGFDAVAPAAAAAAARGFAYVDRQNRGGLWFCHWFTHLTYGTCYGIEALAHRGRQSDPRVTTALAWFAAIAQPDGGFGEASASHAQRSYCPGPPTPFHTGCVLMAFARAGAADHPTAQQAARWLVAHQDADGGWYTDDYFASGIPGVWYANFEAIPIFYAAKGLALYRSASGRSSAPPPAPRGAADIAGRPKV